MTIPLASLATSSEVFRVISNAKGNKPFLHVKASNFVLEHHFHCVNLPDGGRMSAIAGSLRYLCEASFVFRGPLTGYLLCERCNGKRFGCTKALS